MSPPRARAAKALTTRRKMVAAAYRRFGSNGYTGTTMASIADEAGVAVQTLYYTFHTKAALLAEAIGAAVVGIDRWREPPTDPDVAELVAWHDWWQALAAAPTAAAALDVFVTSGVPILERVSALVPAMHATAGDPDAAEVVRIAEVRRHESHREVIRVLAGKPPGLKPGLDEETATDVLLALFSPDAFATLRRRQWSVRRCEDFFRAALAGQLLADGFSAS